MPDPTVIRRPSDPAIPTPGDALAAALRDRNLNEVLTEIRDRVPGIFAALSRQIHLDELLAASGSVGEVTIDKVLLGDASVDNIRVNNTTATLHAGSAYLEGVSVNLELQFKVDWWYDIGIYDDSGTWDLGSMWIGLNVGNITIPSLSDIKMNIPTVTVSNVRAQMPPLTNLKLGSSSFTGLKVKGTALPVQGFVLNGLGLGALSLNSMSIPDVQSEQVRIDRFKPTQQIVLPGATVSGVDIPSTSVPGVASAAFGMDAVSQERSLSANAGVFGIKIRILPIAHMHINAMRMQNLALSARVGSVAIENVRVPIDVQGIGLQKLGLSQVAANNINL
ncbi:MAG TPA: hypothetical protein VH877_10990 [Polyangia bacterium]|jgi:hypothetical protein|nr:hypothetical protein [Polyangia bacterium]